MTPAALFPALSIVGALAAIGTVLVGLIGIVRKPEPERYRQIWIKLGLQLLLIALFVGAPALGPQAVGALLVLLAIRAWFELLRALEGKYGPMALPSLAMALGSMVPLAGLTGAADRVFLAAFIATWLAIALPMLLRRKPPPLHGMGFSAFGMAYISVPLGLLLILASRHYGAYAFLILILMAHDGFAEGFGRLFGKRPIWPDISPGKTLGGTLGGIGASLVLACFLTFLVPDWTFPRVLESAGAIAVSAAIGDLVASAMKREAGIKDFGRLIPTHGGVLDRVDSLIFTTPIFFAAFAWLGGNAR